MNNKKLIKERIEQLYRKADSEHEAAQSAAFFIVDNLADYGLSVEEYDCDLIYEVAQYKSASDVVDVLLDEISFLKSLIDHPGNT